MTYTTILVPTHNRKKMMKRFLDYMYSEKVNHKILIVDSSDDPDCELATKEMIKRMASALNISYSHMTGCSIYQKYLLALNSVDTDYVCTLADHNFLNMNCLIECENFLNNNCDYSHVNGRIYNTSLQNKEIIFKEYPQIRSEAVSSIHRVVDHLEDYTNNFYTVCRVSSLSRLHLVFNSNIGRSLKERLATIVPLADGKRMVLDCDFLVRDKSSKKTGEDETGSRTLDDDPKDSSYIEDISFGFNEYVKIANQIVGHDRVLDKNEMTMLELALTAQHDNWKKKKIRERGFRKTVVSCFPKPLRRAISSVRHFVAANRNNEPSVVGESRSPFLSKVRPHVTIS